MFLHVTNFLPELFARQLMLVAQVATDKNLLGHQHHHVCTEELPLPAGETRGTDVEVSLALGQQFANISVFHIWTTLEY